MAEQKQCDGASGAGTLTFRMIEGLPVYEDGDADLIRDVDLAQQAELAKPRNIRAVIQRVIADGGVTVIGSAAQEVLAEAGGARSAGAAKAPSAEPFSEECPRKTPGNGGARAAGATIRAENLLVQNGDRGAPRRSSSAT